MVSCIVYDNTTQIGTGDGQPLSNVTYSCIESGYTGTGNISSNPLFVDAGAGDYRLTWDSQCVDAGKLYSTEEGETDIDGNPRVLNGHVDVGADEDYPHCRPEYDDWVLLGRPDCWMTPYQCDGDADVADSGFPAYYRVYIKDMDLIVDNWQKRAEDPTLDPCADVDHEKSNFPGYYRVYTHDLDIVVANWQKQDDDLPGDCAECGRLLLAEGSETEIDFHLLAKRLEEIWLNPAAQETIDKKAWNKMLKSVLTEAKE